MGHFAPYITKNKWKPDGNILNVGKKLPHGTFCPTFTKGVNKMTEVEALILIADKISAFSLLISVIGLVLIIVILAKS